MTLRVAKHTWVLVLMCWSRSGQAAPDGGVFRQDKNRMNCASVRAKPYQISTRGHVYIRYSQEIERCFLRSKHPVKFYLDLGKQARVRIQTATKEQASCLREAFRSLSFPIGTKQTIEFGFSANRMEDKHERVPLADLADAGGKGALGWCAYDGDCLPDGICSCSDAAYCSLTPSQEGDGGTRGTCRQFAEIECVRE